MDKDAKYYAYAEEHFVVALRSLDCFDEREINQYLRILEKYKFKQRKTK